MLSFATGTPRLATFPTVKPTVAKLLAKQSGTCQHCGQYFQSDDRMEVRHLDRNPSNYKPVNLALVHRHCHDAVHRGVHDQHQSVEEPCEVSSLKHGFVERDLNWSFSGLCRKYFLMTNEVSHSRSVKR